MKYFKLIILFTGLYCSSGQLFAQAKPDTGTVYLHLNIPVHLTDLIAKYKKNHLSFSEYSEKKISDATFYRYESELVFNEEKVDRVYIHENDYHLIIPYMPISGKESQAFLNVVFESNLKLPKSFFTRNILPPTYQSEYQGEKIYILHEPFIDIIRKPLQKIIYEKDTTASLKLSLKEVETKRDKKSLVFKIFVSKPIAFNQEEEGQEVNKEEEESKKDAKTDQKKYTKGKYDQIIIRLKDHKQYAVFKMASYDIDDKEIKPSFDEDKHQIVLNLKKNKLRSFNKLKISGNDKLPRTYVFAFEELSNNGDGKSIVVDSSVFNSTGIALDKVFVSKIVYDDVLRNGNVTKDAFSFTLNDGEIIEIEEDEIKSTGDFKRIEQLFKLDNKLKHLSFTPKYSEYNDSVEVVIGNKIITKKIENSWKKHVDYFIDKIEVIKIFYPNAKDKMILAELDTLKKEFKFKSANKIEYELILKPPPSNYRYVDAKSFDHKGTIRYRKKGELNLTNVKDGESIHILPLIKLKKVISVVFFDCNKSRNTDQIIREINTIKKKYKENVIAGFSITLAYSQGKTFTINSWDEKYASKLEAHISDSSDSKMLLRTFSDPYAIPAKVIGENINQNASAIRNDEKLQNYQLDFKIFLSNRTFLSIPNSEKYLIDHYELQKYETND